MKKLSIKTIFESVLNEERGDNYFKALMTTKPEVLTGLAQDKDLDVRLAVLKNPGVTPLILQTMSRDENHTVRSIVAQNKATSPEVLAELSKDKEFVVRYYVASNPGTPKEIIHQLTNDKDKNVATKAKGRMSESFVSESEDEYESSLDNNYLKLISKSKDVQLLKKLSRHKNPSVRSMVAQNPLTPVDVLINLFNTSKEPDDIDAAVISNPSVGEDFLRHVIKNGTPLQQREAQFHLDRLPNLSRRTRKRSEI